MLRAIHKEIGLLVDVHNFYIAFQRDDELFFEFDVRNGQNSQSILESLPMVSAST